ncbi:MAG: hypothetical protein IPM74_02170 [Crocinitomicaceae bacterium]|nr:hypothetical protein [Crocinitomicaceae bacterium]MBK8924722.1 hypothetical protein [Crocinitomicaceae bacterium]
MPLSQLLNPNLAIITAFIILSCNNTSDYELVSNDGVYIEEFESFGDHNRYNENNTIFRVGCTFSYRYEYISSDGQSYQFKVTCDDNDGRLNDWKFNDSLTADSLTIQTVTLEVWDGNPMKEPDYDQTVICYILWPDTLLGSPVEASFTGVIENEKNIWMHPPRSFLFGILEINPFPFIQKPYEIGNKWTWELSIGDQWADERWKEWKGAITNEMKYEITAKKIVESPLGDLECFVIQSSAKSKIGETFLTSYFHPVYGFVQMNYINIDSSRLNFYLVDYSCIK